MPAKRVKSFRADPVTAKAIEIMAEREKRSEAQIIAFAVEEYFINHFPGDANALSVQHEEGPDESVS